MKNLCYLLFLSFAVIVPMDLAEAKVDKEKELQKQRNTAQKERQDSRNERNQGLADATKSFREMTRNLKIEYQARLQDLDTEFQLKHVELQADRDAKIANAEAEYQKKWSSLFMRPGGQWTPEALKEVEKEAKAYSDELFRLKKESAETAHKEKMAIEEQKHALLKEMDEKAMDQAASLGLTKAYPPILAIPIGDELTRPEKQWNEREQKEVEKIQERNLQIVSEFLNGEKLRNGNEATWMRISHSHGMKKANYRNWITNRRFLTPFSSRPLRRKRLTINTSWTNSRNWLKNRN